MFALQDVPTRKTVWTVMLHMYILAFYLLGCDFIINIYSTYTTYSLT